MSNQHYVPQALLRNFAFDALQKQVYVMKTDLMKLLIKKGQFCSTKVIRAENISRVCSEINYLSTTVKNFDDEFTEIDSKAPVVVKKINANSFLNVLCKSDKKVLAQFAAYQHSRGRAIREKIEELFNKHFNYIGIKKFLESPSPIDIILLKDSNEYIKEIHGNLLNNTDPITSFLDFLELDVITKEKDQPEFVIGDSPVLYDATGHGIYLPISPIKCLWFHRQEIKTPLRSQYLNELQLFVSKRHLISSNQENLNYILTNPITLPELKLLDDSYWKCILETKNSKYCIENYLSLM